MAHVPIYHIETGKHKPVTAARRFIAENALSAPSVFNVRRNEHTTDRFFWGENGLFDDVVPIDASRIIHETVKSKSSKFCELIEFDGSHQIDPNLIDFISSNISNIF